MGLGMENLSQRKLDSYEKYSRIIQWGRQNPVKFVELFLGIEFLDFQKYVFL